MTQFDRTLTGWKFIPTQRGDSLQKIAERTFQDATRWAELAWINGLEPPYLTDDEASAGPNVLLAGALIRVPAPASVAQPSVDSGDVFKTDLALSDGLLTVSGGDFVTVSGLDNLTQALANAIETEQGDLIFHRDYGCLVRRELGATNGPTAGLLAAEFCKSPVAADPRIAAVNRSTAIITGSAIDVTVLAQTIAGDPITVIASP